MLRYMIAPIVGTGTDDDEFRANLPRNVNVNQRIPTYPIGHPQKGHPLYRCAFCIVATPSIAIIEQVTNSYVFPDYPLDGLLSGMDQEKRAAMIQSAQAYDLDGRGYRLVVPNNDSDSFRDVITSIGLQFDPSFQLAFFGVAEVSS